MQPKDANIALSASLGCDMNAVDDDARDPRAAMARIADVLGEPVDSLTAPDEKVSETQEVLQSWLALDTAEKRRTVLATLRKLVEH